jgi:hypothetical protein
MVDDAVDVGGSDVTSASLKHPAAVTPVRTVTATKGATRMVVLLFGTAHP